MKVLYRRIVTIGMISFSAVLGWIYCILEYRDKPAYIAVISLVLIAAVYCLLSSCISLVLEREAILQRYMADTISEAMSGLESGGYNEEAVRLSKAAYVQQRKTNTILAQLAEGIEKSGQQSEENGLSSKDSAAHLINETINKATRIIVKYNQSNNTETITAIRELSVNLDKIGRELDRIGEELTNRMLTAPQADEQPSADVIPFPMPEEAAEASEAHAVDAGPENNPLTDAVPTDAASTDDANRQLSADEIAALFASVSDESNPITPEETEAVVSPPMDEDPNRQMSQDEIAALLASMQG